MTCSFSVWTDLSVWIDIYVFLLNVFVCNDDLICQVTCWVLFLSVLSARFQYFFFFVPANVVIHSFWWKSADSIMWKSDGAVLPKREEHDTGHSSHSCADFVRKTWGKDCVVVWATWSHHFPRWDDLKFHCWGGWGSELEKLRSSKNDDERGWCSRGEPPPQATRRAVCALPFLVSQVFVAGTFTDYVIDLTEGQKMGRWRCHNRCRWLLTFFDWAVDGHVSGSLWSFEKEKKSYKIEKISGVFPTMFFFKWY